MYHDAFKPLSDKAAQDFLREALVLLDGAPFGAQEPRVLARKLPFYPEYELLEVVGSDTHPPVVRAFIRHKDTSVITLLNWTNEPVYHLNKTVPIVLNDETVLPYVRFFFTYIKGKQGRFLIVDNPDEIEWKDEPPPAGRKALAKMIEPLSVTGRGPDGAYYLQASLIFKDSLFVAKITVETDGQVAVSDEELLVEDIPIRDDVIGL